MSQIVGPVWTKQAKLEGGSDPLGLDRVSDRLTSELMPGISVNVNLARYFSFFPWLFDTTRAENQNDLWEEIVRAEKIYALGASLAHDGERCATGIAGSDLVGDDVVGELWDRKQQINLDKIKWLTNQGVYAGLYKGPLFKLGLLEADSKGKVVVTKIGKPLADAFHRQVSFTDWAKRGRTRAVVTRSEIKQFGKQSCPCSLSKASLELSALRHLFFETQTRQGRILSQSLSFILSLIDQCDHFESADLEQSFRLAIFYGKIYNDKARPIKFKVLSSLGDIMTHWRSFQAHDYFSFALESLFSVWLEIMFSQPGQRIILQQFMDQIDNKLFISILRKRLDLKLSAKNLGQVNIDVLIKALLRCSGSSSFTAENSIMFDKKVGLESEISEEQLKDSIWERHSTGSQYAERCADALILLLVLYVRFYYQHLRGQSQPGWNRYEATSSQSESDLGLPLFYSFFPRDTILGMSVYEFLVTVLHHNIIQQSLIIREERRRDLIWFSESGIVGLGDISPLTQAYQYHFLFGNYRFYRNSSKLNNALALLSDIEYITVENGFWKLTRDGRSWLRKQFGD